MKQHMHRLPLPHLLAAAASTMMFIAGVRAQTSGASPAADQEPASAELVKKLQNPLANLISLPVQNDWDFNIGPAKAMHYNANVQPVIPISLSEDWLLITRTIVPVVYRESPLPGSKNKTGVGDILQSLFLSPTNQVSGWIVGAGAALLYPGASDAVLGMKKWGAGPTVVALRQGKGFTFGALVNRVWSYAGWGNTPVDASYLQPFGSVTLKSYTTFGFDTESTYDREHRQWTVALNTMVSQLFKIGGQPLQFSVGARYYADKPVGGPNWGIRSNITLLFPEGAR
ncbi:MAG TPA: transporter [Bacteroidota bacterium]|nr:transporter [Bacteroidota bacterium]